MTTVGVTEDELELVLAALHAFLDDFGDDEIDVVGRIEELPAKLPAETAGPLPAT